jgi:hypothetical protein
MALLDKAKMAMRITTNAYDAEITDLIEAAKADLGIAGVELPGTLDPICERAIITYCRVQFGSPDDHDRLKASYDEQKAQLATATGYTVW